MYFFFLEKLEIGENFQYFNLTLEHLKGGPGPLGQMILPISLGFRVMQSMQAGWAKAWI